MIQTEFNPNEPGVPNGNYFALPWSVEEADIVLLSVPWDVTASYRPGTHRGPKAMVDASVQIDLFDPLVPNAWDIRIGTLPALRGVEKKNKVVRKAAETVFGAWERGEKGGNATEVVNRACEELNNLVYKTAKEQLMQGKRVGVVGGEHSVPLGLIRALCDQYESFGILHIDAHADLRCAYEGFTYSHASIMYNAIRLPQVHTLVQAGVRDYCQEEAGLMAASTSIHCFTDQALRQALFMGDSWRQLCNCMIDKLPDHVYISFDIDGLTPDLCPHTGTPVPGGLSFREADYLLHTLAVSGKKVIGFDLCEVAPEEDGKNEWDANVGARLLYKLCCYSHLNQTVHLNLADTGKVSTFAP